MRERERDGERRRNRGSKGEGVREGSEGEGVREGSEGEGGRGTGRKE